MDLGLAQVAAGLPMAASLAVAGGFASLRQVRRRAALNEAMHELRRPLQVLSLALPEAATGSGPARSSLSLAAAALDRLDREINGRSVGEGRALVALVPLLEAALARWRPRAEAAGRSLRVKLGTNSPVVFGNSFDLAQAVDNMISNALEHGGGAVVVELREIERGVAVAIHDAGRPTGSEAGGFRPGFRTRIGGRSRRGHGLRVVERIARENRGRFELRRSAAGTEARLELPAQVAGAGG